MKLSGNRNGTSNALIIVAKQPAPGKTKTRLSPPLSQEQASLLYEALLKDTLTLVRKLTGVHLILAYLPEGARTYFERLAPGFDLILQEGTDLGERMDHALTYYLKRGYVRVVIMDSDSPTLPDRCLKEAFDALVANAEVVLGPTEDGGYYLIGLTQPRPRLLCEVRMSTPTVAADTLAIAAAEGLPTHLLPTWYDIDNAADLLHLQEELGRLPREIAPHTRLFLEEHAGVIRSRPGDRA